MPTAQVVAKYDQLTQSIVYLLDLKKSVDKLEAEHRTKVQRTPFARDVMSIISPSEQKATHHLVLRVGICRSAR